MSRRYGEVARLWWRTGARGLSPNAKIVELAIRTGPQSTALPGLVEADALVLASVTELSVPDVEDALAELVRLGRIEVDAANTLIAIVDEPSPDDPVKSYKQLLGAWSCYGELPPSPLRARWVGRYRAACDLAAEKMGETWARTFGTVKATDTHSDRVSDTHSIPATASSEQRAASSGTKTCAPGEPAGPARARVPQLALVSAPTGDRDRFDLAAVYEAYPRKIGKAKGLLKLASQIKTAADFDALLRAAKNYAGQQRIDGTDEAYIKHFSSWVGEWRDWVEHIPSPTRARARSNAAPLPRGMSEEDARDPKWS